MNTKNWLNGKGKGCIGIGPQWHLAVRLEIATYRTPLNSANPPVVAAESSQTVKGPLQIQCLMVRLSSCSNTVLQTLPTKIIHQDVCLFTRKLRSNHPSERPVWMCLEQEHLLLSDLGL